MGYSQKDISEILGTSPAAVTLYSKDRRGSQLSKIIESDKNARLVIDNLMEQIAQRKVGANVDNKDLKNDTFPLILDAAYRIMLIVSSAPTEKESVSTQSKSANNHSDSLTEALVGRLQEEQLAAQRNMALAVGTSDEVARTIFRQIASDSIRHAEIVSFLLVCPRMIRDAETSQRMLEEEAAQIESMIRGEESATEEPIKLKSV